MFCSATCSSLLSIALPAVPDCIKFLVVKDIAEISVAETPDTLLISAVKSYLKEAFEDREAVENMLNLANRGEQDQLKTLVANLPFIRRTPSLALDLLCQQNMEIHMLDVTISPNSLKIERGGKNNQLMDSSKLNRNSVVRWTLEFIKVALAKRISQVFIVYEEFSELEMEILSKIFCDSNEQCFERMKPTDGMFYDVCDNGTYLNIMKVYR